MSLKSEKNMILLLEKGLENLPSECPGRRLCQAHEGNRVRGGILCVEKNSKTLPPHKTVYHHSHNSYNSYDHVAVLHTSTELPPGVSIIDVECILP